jgi:hypothetical protein
MNQQGLFDLVVLDDDAYLAAKKLIEVYVLRGDSIKSLKSGMMGAVSPNSYWVSISGFLDGKRYGSDKIIVERDMKGKKVNRVFDLEKVYKDIKENNHGNAILQSNEAVLS